LTRKGGYLDLLSRKEATVNPDELLFAKTHEWAKVANENGAKVATVGISHSPSNN